MTGFLRSLCWARKSSVKLPCAPMNVTPALRWVPERPVIPAGLKKIAEPSAQGRAAVTPARPMAQVLCSYTLNPCAASRGGDAATSEEAPASTTNANRRIRVLQNPEWGDGESGRDTVALAGFKVKPMPRPAIDLFHKTFGTTPRCAASAPGRVNLIGEHTDYNGGPVLPIAIAHRTTAAIGPGAAVAPGDAGVLEAVSTRDNVVVKLRWQEELPRTWAAYIAGVLRELWALDAIPADTSARVAVASDVPVGAGLSSSAALSVAAAKAFAPGLTPRQIAGVAYRAEHDHVGVPCGLMDQTISALGK